MCAMVFSSGTLGSYVVCALACEVAFHEPALPLLSTCCLRAALAASDAALRARRCTPNSTIHVHEQCCTPSFATMCTQLNHPMFTQCCTPSALRSASASGSALSVFMFGHMRIQRHQGYKNYSRVHYRETCAFGHWWFQSSISVSGSLHSVVYLGYTCEYAAARREWCEWMRRGRHGVLHGNRDEDACRDRSSFSSVQWFRALFFLQGSTHVTARGA